MAQIEESVKVLDNIAQKAQDDLGLPLAWLQDVTVQDWTVRGARMLTSCCPPADVVPSQRYHALVDSASSPSRLARVC